VRPSPLFSGLGEVLWWLVRDGNQAPLINEGVRVVEFGQVHKSTLGVFGPEPLEDSSWVLSLTYLAIDLRWFGPLVGVAYLCTS